MKRILILILLILAANVQAMENKLGSDQEKNTLEKQFQYVLQLCAQRKSDAGKKISNAFCDSKEWLEKKGSDLSKSCNELWNHEYNFTDAFSNYRKAVNEMLQSWLGKRDTQEVVICYALLPVETPENEHDTQSIPEQQQDRLYMNLEDLSEKNVEFMWQFYDKLKETQEKD